MYHNIFGAQEPVLLSIVSKRPLVYLRREVRYDMRVCLEAPQHEGLGEALELLKLVLVSMELNGFGPLLNELLQGASNTARLYITLHTSAITLLLEIKLPKHH